MKLRLIYRIAESLHLHSILMMVLLFAIAGCGGGNADNMNPGGLDERPTAGACEAFDSPGGNIQISLERAFANLTFDRPIALLQAPQSNLRWYLVEQSGRILIFNNIETTTGTSTFIDISGQIRSGGEMGLLGMAFDPDFGNNGHVYLSYTAQSGALFSYISRFTSSDGGLTLDPASEEIILQVEQPYTNHNGGQIAFGSDGFLYIGLGDGGSGGDPLGHGQNINSLLGAMLRIDVNGAAPYDIPADNPFAASSGCVSGNGCREIYAWGLRNPWRWSVDSLTGELWAGDVGQGRWEEIDYIEIGKNYGWNVLEGNQCYPPGTTNCDATDKVPPVTAYGRTEGNSVTGGYVYRGSSIPGLYGKYLYADFGSGRIWAIEADPDTTEQPVLLLESGLNISSFARDNDDELYVLDYAGGTIQRIVPKDDSNPPGVPNSLIETGYVIPETPWQPVSCFIPYDINAPFWSDRAEKERWFAIPDGTQIRVEPDGNWQFPIGSVLIKQFSLGNRNIETRLLIRHNNGAWLGYTYEWNVTQTDATLVTGGLTRQVDGQSWIYPSGSECLKCHTTAAGRSLGLETGQMNRSFTYPSTAKTANQLLTLETIEMFANALPDIPANLKAYPDPEDETQSLESRVKSYLHTNCAQCHRPGGPTPSTMDLRYEGSLAQMNICMQVPIGTSLGIPDARLIYPGRPDKSLIPLRTKRRDIHGMPPLASSVVDSTGAELIDSWILEISTCP